MPEDERKLVERARRGEEAAFAEIVRRYQDRAYGLAFRITGNDADARDAVQEAFVRAFRSLDQFGGRSRVYTWLYRIVVNCALNLRRGHERQRSRDERAASGGPAGTPSPERIAGARERARAVAEAMDALAEPLRAALVLVVFEGLTYREASEVLEVPAGTVAWRVHEARNQLRQRLAGFVAGAAGSSDDEENDGLPSDPRPAVELR